jgi:hypothetical protein
VVLDPPALEDEEVSDRERIGLHYTFTITANTSSRIRKEESMGEIVHTSRIKIVREAGPTRRAVIEGFDEPIFYGVHGGIKKFYKIDPEKEHAATLDHIVAATAA